MTARSTGTARAPLAGRLAQVVETQTAIARAGLRLGSVLRLVAGQARELTGAADAVVVVDFADSVLEDQPVNRALVELCAGEAAIVRRPHEVAVPIRVGGRVVAVLAATWTPPEAATDDDVQLLQLLAGLLGPPLIDADSRIDPNFELERLAHFSTHDVVTSLPNHALINDRLYHALALARRVHSRLCLLLVELEGFGDLNPEIGPALADQALRIVAGRIRGSLREPDTVARMPGARFLILLAGDVTPGAAGMLAARVREAAGKPVRVGAHVLHLRAAVGAAFYPYDGLDPQALMTRAEQALAGGQTPAVGD